jgi:amino acid transporter
MLLVVITIIATSPLLTLWATTLLDVRNRDPNQFISLLGGVSAGPWLQTEVAATAALLLVFASNTAIIGCYHVFVALSRMRFLPQLIQRRNRLWNTPHIAILAATTVPVAIVILANGNVSLLGDMYAFGLLGAFSVTSVSLDIVRWRERSHRDFGRRRAPGPFVMRTSMPAFVLGIATSFLVVLAWVTNLFAKATRDPVRRLRDARGPGRGWPDLLDAAAPWVARRRAPGPSSRAHPPHPRRASNGSRPA